MSEGLGLGFLRQMRPYFRQVAGLLVIGSLAGIAMNIAVVLPSVLLGHAVDAVLAFHRGQATGGAVTWAALLLVIGTAATEVPRVGKRWWLGVAQARIRANVRADAVARLLGGDRQAEQIAAAYPDDLTTSCFVIADDADLYEPG